MKTSTLLVSVLSASASLALPVQVEDRGLLDGLLEVVGDTLEIVVDDIVVPLTGTLTEVLGGLAEINEKNNGKVDLPTDYSSDHALALNVQNTVNQQDIDELVELLGGLTDNEDDESLSKRGIQKRSYVDVVAHNLYSYYTADMQLGTPGQSATLQIDTGSSDLWIWDATVPNDNAQYSFDPTASSSLKNVSEEFTIGYGNGSSTIKGYYVQDNVEIGGSTISSQQFGIGTSGNAGSGIFGIGPKNIEMAETKYINVPESLKLQNIISRWAYSVYLNNASSVGDGSLLFGGIDMEKVYNKQLYTVPMQENAFVTINIDDLWVGSSHYDAAGMGDYVMLDCGSSFSYVPDDTATSIAETFGATFNESLGMYFTDDYPSNHNIILNIRGVYLLISQSEFLIDASIYYRPAPAKYALTILPNSWVGGRTLFGANFMRNLYTVVDFDNMQVSLANAVYSGSSDIYDIPSGDSLVPGAQKATGYDN